MQGKEMILKDKKVRRIYAGDIYVSCERGEILSTLLGSCVAVCLSDELNSIYGINHYMLPEKKYSKKNDDLNKYAEPAINNLISLMINKGAELRFMEAKIFGGAFVAEKGLASIPDDNILKAKEFLTGYGLAIKAEDVGGKQGRQIYYCTGGAIYSRKIPTSNYTKKTGKNR
ncbi:MAG: chemotaxis protein CheD [bacterium]